MNQDVKFPQKVWSTYDYIDLIMDVICGLLDKNPEKRLSAKEALSHRLFKEAKNYMRKMGAQ